ncbi:hypothetical protein GCM10010869_55220 [Mesorhizobium tianshanense]|nr:hypothetical protein GCM10010869_55220 [Mesorhizobium tianshanense]
MIGLTTVQSDYVARARYELLSGEPDRLRAYLNRRRRDKRFDRTITAAIRDGKPIPTKLVARIVDRWVRCWDYPFPKFGSPRGMRLRTCTG